MRNLQSNPLFKQSVYINGVWERGIDRERIPVINPATHEPFGTVPSLTEVDIERAVESAQKAFHSWRKQTARVRGDAVRRWAEQVLTNVDDLATIVTTEQGKPLAEARAEVIATVDYLNWFAEEARRVYGELVPAPRSDQRILVHKEPVGVCAAITPWNFPLSMIPRKAGPAIAAGCSIIIKPAEATPFSALALAELAHRAGIPPGVLNVVTGKAQVIGGVLMGSPAVRKVTFTGSTQVGKLLMRQGAETVKRMSLELGGNAPFIIFEDADLDQAVANLVASKYRNAGQTCICTNRILVQESIYQEVADRLVAAVEKLNVGFGNEDGVTMGPLIDEAAVKAVDTRVSSAVAAGARIATGGRAHPLGGSFYEPTVMLDVTADMDIAQDEIFGPVASMICFKTEEEAIRMANDTPYGLASYFFTRDLGRAWRVSEGLEYGMVGVNDVAISTPEAPFGGLKESGIGREGSKHGIEEYVELKYVSLGGMV